MSRVLARLWALVTGRPAGDGDAARAKAEAERQLAETKRMWPQTRETHDQLAKWIEDALRGNR